MKNVAEVTALPESEGVLHEFSEPPKLAVVGRTLAQPPMESDLDPASAEEAELLAYIRHAEFKRILNRLCEEQARRGFRTLALMSQYPGEGKSFFAAAIALGYARYLGRRVLVVDTVRRLPERPLCYDRIYSEASDFQLGVYLDSLSHRYDLVLVDTCALDAVTTEHMDPVVIGRQVESALLITSSHSRERENVQALKHALWHHGVPFIGVVFNAGA